VVIEGGAFWAFDGLTPDSALTMFLLVRISAVNFAPEFMRLIKGVFIGLAILAGCAALSAVTGIPWRYFALVFATAAVLLHFGVWYGGFFPRG
jgi:hypothetical protein